MYGPLNVKTDFATLTDTAVTPGLTEDAYISQMVQDLTEAMPDLVDKYNPDPSNGEE